MSTSAEHIAALNLPGERRFYRRVAPSLLIYVAFGPNNLGMLVNVSESGLLVSTPCGLDLNSVFRVSLHLNGLPNAIKVHVRTVWTAESQTRSGIQLLDLSEHDREQIRKWAELQPPRNENLEGWFSPENADLFPEAKKLPPVLAESPEKRVIAPGLAPPFTSSKVLHSDKPLGGELPVVRDAVAPRTSGRSSRLVLMVWSASMAAICLATAWTFRHDLADRLLNRPAYHAKESVSWIATSPSRVQLNVPGPVAPPSVPRPRNPGPSTAAATAPEAAPSNISVSKNLEPKPPGVKLSLNAPPEHSNRATETPNASDSDVADSGFDSYPTNDAMPAPAASDPVEILPSANVSAINDSAAKILSSDASPRKSAITGSISNATRPSPFNTSTASGSTLIPTRRPAFLPPSIAGSTTYVERRSESRVINMDAPEARLTELTTKSRTAAFVLLPGERVLNSPSVTMHIRRSVWVHGDHWPWHSHQKLALGKLTSRVNPQVSPLSPTSGTITVQATIDKDGRVQDLKHLNGSFAFFPSVAIAVREWHYDSTYVDNKPVETQAQIEVDFHPPATRASRP